MNESMNQTPGRTILTRTVMLIPILCLSLFGGAITQKATTINPIVR